MSNYKDKLFQKYQKADKGLQSTFPAWLIIEHQALEKRVKELGKLFAEYRSSEGCSCCEDTDTHNEIEQNLGELLNVPRDKYNSGYDWDKLLTPAGGGE